MSNHTKHAVTLALIAGFVGLVTTAHAGAVVLDQSNPATNAGFNSGSYVWQQEVIAGLSGTLDSVDLYLQEIGTMEFAVFGSGAPWQGGTPDFSTTVNVNGFGVYTVDVSSANIAMMAGDSFVLQLGLSSGNSDFMLAGTFEPIIGDGYPGVLFLDGPGLSMQNYDELFGSDSDLGFQTYVDTGSGCPWDCGDTDGTVGIVDFLAVLAQWGGPGTCDFDGGGVGINDFLALLANWGPCP